MKKIKIVLAVAMTGILLAGCAGQSDVSAFSAKQSSIYAARDGSISSAVVQKYEKDYYEQSELQTLVEKEVIAYNIANEGSEFAQNGEGVPRLPVSLQSCVMEKGTAKLIFDYESPEHLIRFAKESGDRENQVEGFEITTVSDGLSKGLISDVEFKKPKDGAAVPTDIVSNEGEFRLIAVEGIATIQTEGRIQYITDGVKMVNDFTATMPEGKSFIIYN